MATYPTVALQPGSTGAAVKQLQDYLVSQGFMTQTQVNTGYGTYGPQTTAAVAKLQASRGVDTAGNPGYWGPRTIAVLSAPAAPAAPVNPPVNPPAQTTITQGQVTPAGVINYDPHTGAKLTPGQTVQVDTPPAANSTPASTPAAPVVTPAKAAYTGSAEYKSLSPDLQKLVDTAFTSFQGTGDQQKAFTDALTNAKALADPYTKSQLALATAEFKLQIAKQTGDYQSQKNILNETITNIQQDLSDNKDNLTLQEQADLATSLRNYQQQGLDLSDSAAEKGLIFATGEKSNQRMQATNDAQYGDVVQSTKRQYNFNIQQLQLKADRGDLNAKNQLAKLEADNNTSLNDIGLNAEKVLGSNNTAALNVPGYTPQGGSLGSIAQDENKSIIDIADKAINTQ